MSQEVEIFNYLSQIGCCKCCCARYLCNKYIDFNLIDSCIQKQQLLKSENVDETKAKRSKQNPCVVCLGLLQDIGLDEILYNDGLNNVKQYDSTVFSCSISMPASIILREHSMRLHLEDKFPLMYTEENRELPLNKTWKLVIKNKLGAVIGKTFENSDVCEFFVNISMEYENDEQELAVLKELQPKMFEDRKLQHKKFSGELYSRKAVLAALEKTSTAGFKLYAKMPPEIPDKFLTCKSIECKHNSIFFAARYCKFSRELSQTPWIINGVKTMESSVQDVIFEQLERVFGIQPENAKFSSSGREDCDVRCLGKGRPIYIEIMDPKKTKYTFQDFRNLERQINGSTLISVRDLQVVHRKDLSKIKEGEQSKTKDYSALCVTKFPVTAATIDKINTYGPVELTQKTPIRVLHRRPLASRKKNVYQMSATLVPGASCMFELKVTTQAGTYVKEFVHGDFGRTKPNLGDIVGMEVDIVALDVVAVNLDWPPEI